MDAIESSTMDDKTRKPFRRTFKSNNEDLDNFMESFDKLMNFTFSLMKEKNSLTEEIKSTTGENERLETKLQESEQSTHDMEGLVDRLQQQLHQVCDSETENRQLKNSISEKEGQIKKLKDIAVTLENQHRDQIQELNNKHETEIQNLCDDLKKSSTKEIDILKQCMDKKQQEIDMLKSDILEHERIKKSEILQLSMDYENKISKLKQKIPTTSNASNAASSSNQEIFRKKLQHMKVEYDREITQLKQTITELQDRLTSQNSTNRLTLTSGKKRKY